MRQPLRRAKHLALAACLLGGGVLSAQDDEPKIKTVSFTRPALTEALQMPAALHYGAQLPGRTAPGYGDSEVDFRVRTELPGPDLLFRRESETQVFERIRQEGVRPGAPRTLFPQKAVVSKEPYQPRLFPASESTISPFYVAHRRLFFEQQNFDRHGWEIGYLQPGISAGKFFYDFVLWPYHCGTDVHRRWDASAGKCLPGDNTPLFCYGERFSVTGLAFQAGAVASGILIFP